MPQSVYNNSIIFRSIFLENGDPSRVSCLSFVVTTFPLDGNPSNLPKNSYLI